MGKKYRIDRPLDFLEFSKGDNVLVILKDKSEVRGELLAFDIHINIVLDNAEKLSEILSLNPNKKLGLTFIRGENIVFIALGDKKQ